MVVAEDATKAVAVEEDIPVEYSTVAFVIESIYTHI